MAKGNETPHKGGEQCRDEPWAGGVVPAKRSFSRERRPRPWDAWENVKEYKITAVNWRQSIEEVS